MLKAIAQKDGLIRALQWVDQQLPGIAKNETYSSFDSELSLIYRPNYPLMRWQPNLLHHRYDGSKTREEKPTMIRRAVEELDAAGRYTASDLAEDIGFTHELMERVTGVRPAVGGSEPSSRVMPSQPKREARRRPPERTA